MKSVHQQCYGSVNEDCSKLAHRDTGLDYEETKKCVDDGFRFGQGNVKYADKDTADYSFDDLVDQKNALLDKEVEYYNKYGPATFPGLVINNQTFRGQLEVEAVLNAICAGFYTTPKMCSKYLSTNDINNKELLFMTEGRHGYLKVAFLCSVIMFVVFLILCCYRRFAKR